MNSLLQLALKRNDTRAAATCLVYGLIKAHADQCQEEASDNAKERETVEGRTAREPERQETRVL